MMMNATGMFIVTEILQAWIPGLDAGYYDNLNYRKYSPSSIKLLSPQDHFKPPEACLDQSITTKNTSLQVLTKMPPSKPLN